jgi:hypothetical protein
MKEQFTAVFQQMPEGYIAFVEELPGANTQGDTLDPIYRKLFNSYWSRTALSQKNLSGTRL